MTYIEPKRKNPRETSGKISNRRGDPAGWAGNHIITRLRLAASFAANCLCPKIEQAYAFWWLPVVTIKEQFNECEFYLKSICPQKTHIWLPSIDNHHVKLHRSQEKGMKRFQKRCKEERKRPCRQLSALQKNSFGRARLRRISRGACKTPMMGRTAVNFSFAVSSSSGRIGYGLQRNSGFAINAHRHMPAWLWNAVKAVKHVVRNDDDELRPEGRFRSVDICGLFIVWEFSDNESCWKNWLRRCNVNDNDIWYFGI